MIRRTGDNAVRFVVRVEAVSSSRGTSLHEAMYIVRFPHACFRSASSYSGCFGILLKGETGEELSLIRDPASIPGQTTRDLWLRNMGLNCFSPYKSVFPCEGHSHECFRLAFLYPTTDATSPTLHH